MQTQLLQHALREAEAGESFLEFRLDYLDHPTRELIPYSDSCGTIGLPRACHLPPAPEHGLFNGSVDEQLAMLHAAVRAGAQAVDVEIESAEKFPGLVEALRQDARLVVSYHNFEGTPQPSPC